MDVKSSSVRSGTGRLSENRGKKSKSWKRMKLRSQGIRSKIVGFPGTEAARKRGDVAVQSAFRYYVLPMEGMIAEFSHLENRFYDYVHLHVGYNSPSSFFFFSIVNRIWKDGVFPIEVISQRHPTSAILRSYLHIRLRAYCSDSIRACVRAC